MMNDEIKEILDRLKGQDNDYHYCLKKDISFNDNMYCSHILLNYITNLQRERDFYKHICLRYGRKGYEELYQEKEDYKSRCEKASDKIQYIIDYGFDYDGFNTVESLKGLIDMLVDYARESKNILQNGRNKGTK